jgi:hypothetical protein
MSQLIILDRESVLIDERGKVSSHIAENLKSDIINGGHLIVENTGGYYDVKIENTAFKVNGKNYFFNEQFLNIWDIITNAISGDSFYDSLDATGKGFLISVYAKIENSSGPENIIIDYIISKIGNLRGDDPNPPVQLNIFDTLITGNLHRNININEIYNSCLIGFIIAEYVGGYPFNPLPQNFMYKVLSVSDIKEDFLITKTRTDFFASIENIKEIFETLKKHSLNLINSNIKNKYSNSYLFLTPGIKMYFSDVSDKIFEAIVNEKTYFDGTDIFNLLSSDVASYVETDIKIFRGAGTSSSSPSFSLKETSTIHAVVDLSTTGLVGELNNSLKPYSDFTSLITDLQNYFLTLTGKDYFKITIKILDLPSLPTSVQIPLDEIIKTTDGVVNNLFLYLDFNNQQNKKIFLLNDVEKEPGYFPENKRIIIENLNNSTMTLNITDNIDTNGIISASIYKNIIFNKCYKLKHEIMGSSTYSSTGADRVYNIDYSIEDCYDFFLVYINGTSSDGIIIYYDMQINVKNSSFNSILKERFLTNKNNISSYNISCNFVNSKITSSLRINGTNNIIGGRFINVNFYNCEDSLFTLFRETSDPISEFIDYVVNSYNSEVTLGNTSSNFDFFPTKMVSNNSNCKLYYKSNFQSCYNIELINSHLKIINKNLPSSGESDLYIGTLYSNNSKIDVENGFSYAFYDIIRLETTYMELKNSTLNLKNILNFYLLPFIPDIMSDLSNFLHFDSSASRFIVGLDIMNSNINYDYRGTGNVFEVMTNGLTTPNVSINFVDRELLTNIYFINSNFKITTPPQNNKLFYYDLTDFNSYNQYIFKLFENSVIDIKNEDVSFQYDFIDFSDTVVLNPNKFDIFTSNIITNLNTENIFNLSENKISLRGESNHFINSVSADKNLHIDAKYYVVTNTTGIVNLQLPNSLLRFGKEYIIFNNGSFNVLVKDGVNVIATILPSETAKIIYLGTMGWKEIN